MSDNIVVSGKFTVDFCFRLEAGAKMARNLETDEPAAAYAKISMDLHKVPSEDEYAEMHQIYRGIIAQQIKTTEDNVTPISFQEWAENQEPEDTSEGEEYDGDMPRKDWADE